MTTDGAYATSYEPARKMDGGEFYVGTCSCGYRSAPTSRRGAESSARQHYEAKHSHAKADESAKR